MKTKLYIIFATLTVISLSVFADTKARVDVYKSNKLIEDTGEALTSLANAGNIEFNDTTYTWRESQGKIAIPNAAIMEMFDEGLITAETLDAWLNEIHGIGSIMTGEMKITTDLFDVNSESYRNLLAALYMLSTGDASIDGVTKEQAESALAAILRGDMYSQYNTDISGITLRSSDLTMRDIYFCGSNISDCNFSGTGFTNITFNSVNLKDTNFTSSEMDDVSICNNSDISNASFENANLKNAIFANVTAKTGTANFKGASLENTTFMNIDFTTSQFDFSGTTFRGVQFNNCNFGEYGNFYTWVYNKFPTVVIEY